MDAAVLANNDAGVLEKCDCLLRRLPLVHAPRQAPKGVDSSSHGVALVPRETKISFVRRLETCDGPLACHAIQECLHRYVCACAAAISQGHAHLEPELDEWYVSVLDTVMECIGEREQKVRGERTTARRLRCAIFLLQLLSNILKAERGASHPERSRTTTTSASRAADTTDDSTKEAAVSAASDEIDCRAWEKEAAQACARASNTYFTRMVQAAAVLKAARGLGDDGDDDRRSERVTAAAALAGEDAGFWVLAFLSDVLKCLRKDNWSYERFAFVVGCKRARDGEARAIKLVSRAPLSPAAAVGTADVDVSGEDGRDSSGLMVDFSGLARLVAEFPVGRGKGAMNLALKWLEVTQLLMEAAETRWRCALGDVLRSVPPALWRLASPTGTLLPPKERSRPPGCAFVEADGADGALTQAMLSVVFRILRRGDVPGSPTVPGVADSDDLRANAEGTTDENGAKGEKNVKPQASRPWSTAAEALAATARASTSGDPAGDGADAWTGFAGRLVRVFSDQDDALVDMLLQNLHLFYDSRPPRGDLETISERGSSFSSELRSLYHGVLHPGVLFAALLSEVRFDSGVLLDWLISPETRFLQYLTMLLRLAVAEWSDFAVRVSCATSSMAGSVCAASSTARAEEREKAKAKEEEDGEEELVLSEEEADRLGKVVSCLGGLVARARGLEKNGLMPYSLAPLLRRIDQVVSLYEDCGDAEEGEGNGDSLHG
eukprot:g9529.t1